MNLPKIPLIFRELCNIDNVIGVGHGHKWVRGENTGQQAIVVLVQKKIKPTDLQRSALIPKTLGGLQTDIIEVGDIRLLNERTEMRRPAQPGMSIGHYKVSAGTFGAVVRDNNTGEPYILSNNHVLANLTDGADGRAAVGDIVLQPGMFDGGEQGKAVIGHLARFVPLHRDIISPRCKIAQLFEDMLNKCINFFQPQYRIQVLRHNEQSNLVDCAIAKPLNSNDIKAEILECGLLNGIKKSHAGMMVKKSGRSSGITHSIVLATEVSVRINVSHEEYGIFNDQVLTGPMSMAGDSGSLILTEDNYAVGLLFAGSEQATMFNKIEHVLNALNVSI